MNSNLKIKIWDVPSFYGILGLFIPYAIYRFYNPLKWYKPSLEIDILVIIQLMAFALSLLIVVSGNVLKKKAAYDKSELSILLLHIIGLMGIVIFIYDVINSQNNLLLLTWISSPLEVRSVQDEITSLGTQLSYAGWLACFLTIWKTKSVNNKIFLIFLMLQIIGNLAFIDKTRFIWMMFLIGIGFMQSNNVHKSKLIFKYIIIYALVMIIFFSIFGMQTGKTYESLYAGVYDGIFGDVYLYLNAGFPYLNYVILNGNHAYMPQESILPVYRIFQFIDESLPKLSTILPVQNLPYSTNVGTALQPFASDGGVIFSLFGILVYSFGFDALAIKFYKHLNPYTAFAIGNLCFANLIYFLAPKINNLSFYIFIFVGLIGVYLTLNRKYRRFKN